MAPGVQHRTPPITLAAILAQQNPVIDLKLEQHERTTRRFLGAVDAYAQRAAAEIARRRTEHAEEAKKADERAKAIDAETTQCKLREIELLAELGREQEEKKEAETSVAALKRQLLSIDDKLASVEDELEQYRAITSTLQREQSTERQTLTSHASSLEQELLDCEHLLGFSCEGVDREQLLFTFADIAPDGSGASFVLHVGGKDYHVLTTTPVLPSVAGLLEELNETGNIYAFVRQMRMAFLELFGGKRLGP